MDTCVKEFMATNMVSIPPETPLLDAIHSMLEHHHTCQIVVEDGFPVGIITEHDIVRLSSRYLGAIHERPVLVREVMSKPVAIVKESTTLFEAMVIAASHRIRHLPVVDEQGRLLGLVTEADLARAHVCLIEKQRDLLEEEVKCKSCDLKQTNEQLKVLSMVDVLMGIGNRRAMEVDMEHTHALAMRHQRNYSIILFDIDYFKRYNDSYGHLAGDVILRQVSDYLQSCIRKSDRLYRYGGEEILMVLPETSQQGAMILAERTVAGMSILGITHASSPFGMLTMSCGVSSQTDQTPHNSWQHVVQQADQALYAAKNAGRNRAMQAAEGGVR